ncbi:MAG TPA: VWA domain-containing protein [Gaiellaceae bacterium]|nr:VWA domain-containing protein [Gaiellaceae bacterium]
MSVHLAVPTALLVGLAGLVPLALALLVDRRNARSRRVLGLPEPGRASRLVLPMAVLLLTTALAFAAARPIVRTAHSRLARLDAEAVIAIDTSRSMDASRTARSPVRLDRARAIAERIRDAIPDVPTGIGTFTDRPLPLVMPTPDRGAFSAALRDSLGIERPPGLQSSTTISSFDAVAPFPLEGYFSPAAKKRLLVILTDAESTGFNETGVRKSFEARPRTAVVLVRIGSTGERVFGPGGQPESAYIPPPATGETLSRFLDATHGRAFDEHTIGRAGQAAAVALGAGPRRRLGTITSRHDLAPWLVLASVLPLGVVLRRRNF